MFSERRDYKYITLLFTLRRDSKGGDFGKLAKKKCHYLTPEIMAFCAPPEIFPKGGICMSVTQVSLIVGLAICTLANIFSDEKARTDAEKGFFGSYGMVFTIAMLLA